MNCLIYARVSTDRQADKELSIRRSFTPVASTRNSATGSSSTKPSSRESQHAQPIRPGLRALLGKCRASEPKVGVVLVHKVYRLARNLADYVSVRGLPKTQGVALASVVENHDDSNSGVLVEHIMASLAEFYSPNLSEEVRKGMQQRVRQGGWGAAPCFAG
jgi:DNA invertase Pin-like site-specific DNA recombinase